MPWNFLQRLCEKNTDFVDLDRIKIAEYDCETQISLTSSGKNESRSNSLVYLLGCSGNFQLHFHCFFVE